MMDKLQTIGKNYNYSSANLGTENFNVKPWKINLSQIKVLDINLI